MIKLIPLHVSSAFRQIANPYEVTRYAVELDGQPIGLVSNHYHDGGAHWIAWTDSGVRQECASRRKAIKTLVETATA